MEQSFNITVKDHPLKVTARVPFSNVVQIEFYDKSKKLLPTGYHNVFTEINPTPIDRMKNILVDISIACVKMFKAEPIVISENELTYTELDIWRHEIIRKRIAGEDGLSLKKNIEKEKPKFEQLKLF